MNEFVEQLTQALEKLAGRSFKCRVYDCFREQLIYPDIVYPDVDRPDSDMCRWSMSVAEMIAVSEVASTRYILMLATGYQDDNGVEIYEGDITETVRHDAILIDIVDDIRRLPSNWFGSAVKGKKIVGNIFDK